MTKEIASNNLYLKIAELLQTARQTVMRTVNQTMVYTYYEIGRMIVEDEQQGKERAEYGKQVLKELSKRLTADFGKGFSVENLDRMRFFYQIYSKSISSTVLTKSGKNAISATSLRKPENSGVDISTIYETTSRKFVLSWSHYLKLMRIENHDENKTVGIVLCHDKSETLVEITLPEDNDQIFASRYQTVLPNKEELKRLLSDKDFEV